MIRWKKNFFIEFLNVSKTHGPIFTFWMGSKPEVIITDLNIAKEAYLEKKNEFAGRPKFSLCSFIIYKKKP